MKKTFSSKKSAFSLIELSIVLIIIGLLIAGITGGASLIKSSELRSVMGEARGYAVSVLRLHVGFRHPERHVEIVVVPLNGCPGFMKCFLATDQVDERLSLCDSFPGGVIKFPVDHWSFTAASSGVAWDLIGGDEGRREGFWQRDVHDT